MTGIKNGGGTRLHYTPQTPHYSLPYPNFSPTLKSCVGFLT